MEHIVRTVVVIQGIMGHRVLDFVPLTTRIVPLD